MTSSNSTEDNSRRLCFGVLAGAHGVKGLVKIYSYCEDPSLLEDSEVFDSPEGGKKIGIELKGTSGKHILAIVEGINTREEAIEANGTELWIEREELPEADDGEFYIEDLKGLSVKNSTGEEIGKIIAVQNFGSYPLIDVKPKSGSTFFIPFTEEYVPEVNLEEGFVTVGSYEDFM